MKILQKETKGTKELGRPPAPMVVLLLPMGADEFVGTGRHHGWVLEQVGDNVARVRRIEEELNR